MFCGGGGGGGGGGVSRSTVLSLGRSGVPRKPPGGVCSRCCWLEGVLIPKACSTMLRHLESCGRVAGRCAAWDAAAAAAVAAVRSGACCS